MFSCKSIVTPSTACVAIAKMSRAWVLALPVAALAAGCLAAVGDEDGDQIDNIGVAAEALYPGAVPNPVGAYTPIFIGNPADTDTLCNFVRNKSMKTIARVVSYDPWSSEDVNFNIVRGTAGNDVLPGTDGPDLICGYEGNDVLRGGLGDDVIIGGQGNDTIYGACGQDFLWGGAGIDTIYGDSNSTSVCGITINGSSPDRNNSGLWDIIYGGAEADQIFGEWGTDAIFGGDFHVDDSVDTISCGVRGQYGGTVYVLHPSSGTGWIADSVTGCDTTKNVP